jgi:hypothetical protein
VTEQELQSFWSRVDKSAGPDACWPWLGAKTPLGYGRWSDSGYAHRITLSLASGATGRVAMHTCDSPSCVNPAHLRWGSHRENSQDMVDKARSTRGEKHGLAKLTEAQVSQIRAAYDAGERKPAIAKRFGISTGTVYNIGRRETWRAPGEPTWRHVPYVRRKRMELRKGRMELPDPIDVEAP